DDDKNDDDENAEDDQDDDKNDDDENAQDDKDDDKNDDDENAQDDDDEVQPKSEDDCDDFIHPKLITHDDETTHEEETDEDDTFDHIVHTPSHVSSSDDEDSDNEVEGVDVEGEKSDEDATYVEDQGNKADRDTNANLEGRDDEAKTSYGCSCLILWRTRAEKFLIEDGRLQIYQQSDNLSSSTKALVDAYEGQNSD
ncbi:hypothetical protein Tco_0544819, partial [Tanacetum coccineum]